MDKKDLKFYEAPVMETVKVELQQFLCGSNPDNPLDGNTEGPEEQE